jgi:hypothetical protein
MEDLREATQPASELFIVVVRPGAIIIIVVASWGVSRSNRIPA